RDPVLAIPIKLGFEDRQITFHPSDFIGSTLLMATRLCQRGFERTHGCIIGRFFAPRAPLANGLVPCLLGCGNGVLQLQQPVRPLLDRRKSLRQIRQPLLTRTSSSIDARQLLPGSSLVSRQTLQSLLQLAQGGL